MLEQRPLVSTFVRFHDPHLIGHTHMISASDIVEMHETLSDWFAQEDPISPPGLKSQELLESAVGRPNQTIGGKDAYPTDFDKAAAIMHSLINNHAFHNANKRVALVAAQVYLAKENQWLEKVTDDEMYEFARKAAAHKICEDRRNEISTISAWLEGSSRKASKEEFPLKFGDLRRALQRFGYDLGPPDGELIDVLKDGKVVERIKKEGTKGFRPYRTHYVAELRKRLGLTRENGMDSVVFYGAPTTSNTASEFIERRWVVMSRLAKT
jgi:death on curing protein